MSFQSDLEQYARLIASLGVNVTEGKYVLLRCPIEAAPLGRLVEKECFARGAKHVVMVWSDQQAARIRYEGADRSVFDALPEWQAEQRNFYAREGCVSIAIVADDPEAYAGLDSDRLLADTRARDRAFRPFYDVMDKGGLRWTVAAYPGEAWARKVFPGQPVKTAVRKLWRAIFRTCRVGRGDIVKKWKAHDRRLKRRAAALNRFDFAAVHFENSLGTDLTIGLAEGHIWKGGSETCAEGVTYFPNLPTEEIFTMPDCRKAEGTVVAALPLSYQGELIEGFRLEFHDGMVTSFGAKSGEGALKRLLDTDEGSKRLGEVALIPHDSPISNMGVLFYETLFDENASCHLALGECYPDTMKGGELLSEDALREKGGNRSANHVDFMIGTADLSVTGIRKDGVRVPIFRKGGFVM